MAKAGSVPGTEGLVGTAALGCPRSEAPQGPLRHKQLFCKVADARRSPGRRFASQQFRYRSVALDQIPVCYNFRYL